MLKTLKKYTENIKDFQSIYTQDGITYIDNHFIAVNFCDDLSIISDILEEKNYTKYYIYYLLNEKIFKLIYNEEQKQFYLLRDTRKEI